jgi:hypothetical protein
VRGGADHAGDAVHPRHGLPAGTGPTAIAIWASVAGASVAASITWSGLMPENFWWGSIFLGMAALAVVTLLAGAFLLPRSRAPEHPRLDPVGTLLGRGDRWPAVRVH